MKSKKLIAGLCAMLLAVPAGFSIPVNLIQASAEVSPVVDSDSLQAYAAQVVDLVNQERAKSGLSALKSISVLDTCAEKRSEEIVSVFSHTRPDGSNCATVLNEYGVNWRTSGENIAYGYATPESVMTGWMNSAGHRANILSENFDSIGVGVVSRNGVLYWTQVFAGGIDGNVSAPEQKPDQNQKPDQSQNSNQNQNSNLIDWHTMIQNMITHQQGNAPENAVPSQPADQPCIGEECAVIEYPSDLSSLQELFSGLQSQCKDDSCQIQIFTSKNSCKS